MRTVICSLLALGACNFGNGDGDDDDYYIEPGGGGGSFGQTGDDVGPDGGTVGDGGALLAGQLCNIADFRVWTNCSTMDFDGYLVELGASQASANGAGVFQIATPSGTSLVWRVYDPSSTAVREHYKPFAPSETVVYSSLVSTYQDLATTNLVDSTAGAVFVRVRQAGAPMVAATATISPVQTGTALTFYDDTSASVWANDATGAAGVIWFPDMPVGEATVTVTPDGVGAMPFEVDVTVVAGAITMTTAEIP